MLHMIHLQNNKDGTSKQIIIYHKGINVVIDFSMYALRLQAKGALSVAHGSGFCSLRLVLGQLSVRKFKFWTQILPIQRW